MVWQRLLGSSRSLAIYSAACTDPVIVVTTDDRHAQLIEMELRFYADSTMPTTIRHFPDWECLPYDNFSPHQDIISERLRILRELPSLDKGIVVLAAANLMQRLPPREYVLAHTFAMAVGDTVRPHELRLRLEKSAYYSVSQVQAPGEFAVRGGVIDIFASGSNQPFRLDLFDDRVESIHYFDPETQRSIGTVSQIELLPAREFPVHPEAVRDFRGRFRRRFDGDPHKQRIYMGVSEGHLPAGVEFYLPLFFDNTATLFDYVPDSSVFIIEGDVTDAANRYESQVMERYESAQVDRENAVLSPPELYLSGSDLTTRLQSWRRILIAPGQVDNITPQTFATSLAPNLVADPKSGSPYEKLVQYLTDTPNRVLLAAETTGRREVLQSVLHEHGIDPQPCASWHEFLLQEIPVAVTVAELERGAVLANPAIAVIAENEVYGEQVYQRRRRRGSKVDPEAVIRSLAELKPTDPVVHTVHGVGRYVGLQTLDIEGEPTEFLTLEYLGEDKLYVPVLSLHLISRYIGVDSEHAPLHKLGTDTWARATRRAREKAYDVAAELLEVEALRNARNGIAHSVPMPEYHSFAAGFPFEETPDQTQVLEEVLADMVTDRPMDRLVCGDVGFGKTEIALRAAFVAVYNGTQVIILAPTTLLARQHHEVFRDRFAESAVRIDALSRFQSKSEQAETIAALTAGRVDIAIGTHRLLQPDVKLRNLGLIIIDEEHRFGVRQKERLKRLRGEVDILTLTATPIPRTLNMAMAGLRSISIIATPPRQRLSIKTFVRNWNKGLIREACLREIRRGGQIYFLHNDVRSISRTAEELQKLMPEGRIQIAHGQMSERELESTMQEFYHQRFDMLVCTTIIESGIDVPAANTIVINRADRFGLAQLHQLRGRVGRSHHQAYAYLLVADRRTITTEAERRLSAIESMEDLGAGFTLASHDLEIRGAGELLGESQSGLIDEVGFTVYSDYLQRAIQALRENPSASREWVGEDAAHTHLELNFHTATLFPEDYLPDVHTRLIMYKRIASARNADELRELQVEAVDRFGLLPAAAKALFAVSEIKLRAAPLGIKAIDIGESGGKIKFVADPNIDPLAIVELIQSRPQDYRMQGPTQLRITLTLPEFQQRITLCHDLLDRLGGSIEH